VKFAYRHSVHVAMEHPQAYRKRYRSRSHLCYFSGGVTVTVVLTVVSVCGNDRTVCEKCSVFMCRAQRVVLVASAAAGRAYRRRTSTARERSHYVQRSLHATRSVCLRYYAVSRRGRGVSSSSTAVMYS